MASPFANATAIAAPRISVGAAAYVFGSSLNPTYGGNSGAPKGVHYDVDAKTAKACSGATFEFPFAHVGDTSTILLTQEFTQGRQYFKPTQLGTQKADDARFLLTDETNFRDLGGGMLRWKREWVTLPPPHNDYESFIHDFQYVQPGSPPTVADKPIKVRSRLYSEFFHVSKEASFDPFQAARFEQLTETYIAERGQGTWSLAGIFFVTSDQEIVAEDSDILVWKWPIMERRTRLVKGPTLKFWGKSFNLPV